MGHLTEQALSAIHDTLSSTNSADITNKTEAFNAFVTTLKNELQKKPCFYPNSISRILQQKIKQLKPKVELDHKAKCKTLVGKLVLCFKLIDNLEGLTALFSNRSYTLKNLIHRWHQYICTYYLNTGNQIKLEDYIKDYKQTDISTVPYFQDKFFVIEELQLYYMYLQKNSPTLDTYAATILQHLNNFNSTSNNCLSHFWISRTSSFNNFNINRNLLHCSQS